MRGVCWHQAPANVPALLGVLAGSAATSQAVAPMAPGPTKPTRSNKSPKADSTARAKAPAHS